MQQMNATAKTSDVAYDESIPCARSASGLLLHILLVQVRPSISLINLVAGLKPTRHGCRWHVGSLEDGEQEG